MDNNKEITMEEMLSIHKFIDMIRDTPTPNVACIIPLDNYDNITECNTWLCSNCLETITGKLDDLVANGKCSCGCKIDAVITLQKHTIL